MSFLSISGLKKAYESLEGEISKTFDSSRTGEAAAPSYEDETTHEKVAYMFLCKYLAREVKCLNWQDLVVPVASSDGGEVAPGKREGGEEDWGEWEEQDGGGGSTSTSTKRSPRLAYHILFLGYMHAHTHTHPYPPHTHQLTLTYYPTHLCKEGCSLQRRKR